MKKQLFLIFFALTTLLSANLKAQEIEKIFNDRPELYFSFELENMDELKSISKYLSIEDIKGNKVTAYANKREFETFLKNGISYTALTPPSMLFPVKMMENYNPKAPIDWDYYPSYDQYLDIMEQFAIDYPNLCEVVDFGSSTQGRKLLACKLSKNVAVREAEPKFLYTATMHGDELVGYPLSLRYINHLLENYGETTPEGIQATYLLDNTEIWINPLANPDGTFHSGNNNVNGATRYNGNSVDLNRNYPDAVDGPHPDGNAWQPETIAFMQLAEEQKFNMSANFHSGATVVNYPWDTWSQLAADDNWWQYVSNEWAQTAQANSPSGYMTGFNNGITNGYQWYSISGGRQDYMNYFQQCREVTLELSDAKLLPASQLNSYWDYNYKSYLYYHEQSTYGLHGIITNCVDGEVVENAMIFIEGHDIDSSMVFSSALGEYFRYLKAGTYTLTYSATGYAPEERTVTITDKEVTIQDVELCCGDLEANFGASQTTVNINSTVEFEDLSSGCPSEWYWEFEGGTPATSTEQNPSITYENTGTYDVSLTVTVSGNNNQEEKTDYISVNEDFIISNSTVTTCSGLFYDSGNISGNYSDNEDYSFTIMPGTASAKVVVNFLSFDVEDNATCNYDWLKIYDGNSASATLIGTFCGTNSPGTVEATNSLGALTFVFHSDNTETRPGWKAEISCSVPPVPPVSNFTADYTVIGVDDVVTFTDNSTGNPTSWEWSFEGGDPETSTEQNPQITYHNLGDFDVTLTTTNQYGDDEEIKVDYIKVTDVGIETQEEATISIYPNPTNGENVIISSEKRIETLNVYDYTGKLINSFAPNANSYELETNNLETGIYLILIKHNDSILSSKLIVK